MTSGASNLARELAFDQFEQNGREEAFDRVQAYDRLSAKIDVFLSTQTTQNKRLRAANDITGKGNRIQYQYNCRVLELTEQTQTALHRKEYGRAEELIWETQELLNYRNKLIAMADESDLGWLLVEHYESNAQAADSDDGNKMRRADSAARATKKRRFDVKKAKGKTTTRSENYKQSDTADKKEATSGHFQSNSSGNNSANRSPPKCYFCDVYGHTRNQCPALKHLLQLSSSK
jgi:hypothetical protein